EPPRERRRGGRPSRGGPGSHRDAVAMRLEGKVALVTGGAHGIGRALCERFVAEGAAGVAVVDLDADGAQALADSLGERAIGLAADVAREADVRAAVAATEARFGPIDLMVSNA